MPYWEPANNDVPSVAEWISYIADQVIAQVTAATRPPGTSMQIIGETDTTRFMAFDGSGYVGFGGLTSTAFTTHTPQIDQGATNITKTTNYSQTMRFGNQMLWQFSFAMTGAGTIANQVSLTTPVTLASTGPSLGSGRIFDSSAPNSYIGSWIPLSTTTIRFFTGTASASAWGIAPSLALASGDSLHGSVWLPIA